MPRDNNGDDAENRERETRRGVLRAVGTGAAISVGLGTTGSATARPNRLSGVQRELKSSYLDPTATKEAFLDNAEGVLETLAERDFLERGAVEELPLDTFQRPDEYANADGAHVTALRKNGVDTAHIVVSKETPTHEVEVVVQPELDRAYARTIPQDGGDPTFVASTDDVSPEGYCWWETDCKAECCVVDGDCRATEYERSCCEQGGLTDCDYWGPTGNCC